MLHPGLQAMTFGTAFDLSHKPFFAHVFSNLEFLELENKERRGGSSGWVKPAKEQELAHFLRRLLWS